MSEIEPLGTAAPMKRPRRRKVTVVGVLGELFITAGVFVLLFLGWQVWLNDIIVGAEQSSAANELSESWDTGTDDSTAAPSPDASPDAEAPEVLPDPSDPLVAAKPADAASFANIIIPRLGSDYIRPIAEGTGGNVINNPKTGVGRRGGDDRLPRARHDRGGLRVGGLLGSGRGLGVVVPLLGELAGGVGLAGADDDVVEPDLPAEEQQHEHTRGDEQLAEHTDDGDLAAPRTLHGRGCPQRLYLAHGLIVRCENGS